LRRLLAAVEVDAEARTLGRPDPALDAATRAVLEQAVAEAHARGVRDGIAQATAAAGDAASRVVAAVQRAEASLRAVAAAADVELALAIAAAVLDREPADEGQVLLERVAEVLARLDDERVAVHLHPDDARDLAEHVERAAAAAGLVVDLVPDPSIAPGEARLGGRWSRADLTRAGALAAVAELLAEAS
jgi:flagellar assembly protein FliH